MQSILNRMATQQPSSTCNRTNKFTEIFRAFTDVDVMVVYRQVNPGMPVTVLNLYHHVLIFVFYYYHNAVKQHSEIFVCLTCI